MGADVIAAWAAFGSMLVSAFTAIVTAFILLRTKEIGTKIELVHIATNSLTDRLVATTRLEAHAAGVKEERDRTGD